MKDAIALAYERIRPWVRETPLELSPTLGAASGVSVFLKLEHLQQTGSFKFRGASNKILLLTPDQAARGIIAASNGNHGLGVAAAAERRGIQAEVFVSSQVSLAKAQRIAAHGARIRSVGDDPLTAEVAARQAAEESGKVFISPYNDVDVIAGQGTIAVELVEQLQQIDAVFVVVGGGGLIGGIGSYLKAFSPETEVVGCWPANSPVLHEALRAGRIVDVAEQPTLSESTSGGLESGSVTVDVCGHVIDRSVMVTEQEILAAMLLILKTEHWLIEGAAGVAVAAFLKEAPRYSGKNVVILLCGRNLSAGVLRRLLASAGSTD